MGDIHRTGIESCKVVVFETSGWSFIREEKISSSGFKFWYRVIKRGGAVRMICYLMN